MKRINLAPQRIIVEATFDAMIDLELDEGERYDTIHDVIEVEYQDDQVVITTCRSVMRPDRPVFEIPLKYLEKIHYPEQN